MGRLQLWLAILMYVSGPAWILFSLVSFGRAIAAANWPAAQAAGGPSGPFLGTPLPWEP